MTTYIVNGIASNNDVIFNTKTFTQLCWNDSIEDVEEITEFESYITFKGFDYIIVMKRNYENGQTEYYAERFTINSHIFLHLVSNYDNANKWDYRIETKTK